MITNEELKTKVDSLCREYTGQSTDLCMLVGMAVVGQYYGWRFLRLTSSRRHWKLFSDLLGDPKELFPERGLLAHRSLGLMIADKLGNFWDIVRNGPGSLTLEKIRTLCS